MLLYDSVVYLLTTHTIALWVESVKIDAFSLAKLCETLVTRSYGDTFPRVSERVSGASEGASERGSKRASGVKWSAAERVSERTSAAERMSERTSGPFFTVPF